MDERWSPSWLISVVLKNTSYKAVAENLTVLMGTCLKESSSINWTLRHWPLSQVDHQSWASAAMFENKTATGGTVSAEGHHQHPVIKSLANSTEITMGNIFTITKNLRTGISAFNFRVDVQFWEAMLLRKSWRSEFVVIWV